MMPPRASMGAGPCGGRHGRLVVDDSTKPQIWHLIKPGSETVNNRVSDCF